MKDSFFDDENNLYILGDRKMLIGIAGQAGVGKTKIASMLPGFVLYSFADAMKHALIEMTGLGADYFYKTDHKEKMTVYGKTPRQMMQLCGTEFARNMIHPDFWLMRMDSRIENVLPSWDVVIDDIRFENEAQWVRDKSGIVVHLSRNFVSPTKENQHVSENKLLVLESDIVIESWDKTEEETLKMLLEKIGL